MTYQDHPTLDITIECPHCWLESGHQARRTQHGRRAAR